jgi:hypothetical protein
MSGQLFMDGRKFEIEGYRQLQKSWPAWQTIKIEILWLIKGQI